MFSFSLLREQVSRDRLFYVLAAALITFLWCLQVAGVRATPSGIYGGDNFGTDFLFHISIGNSVVYSGWPPKLLYADNAANVFPFISDFYNAILIFNGINPVSALYLTNLALYFAIVMCATYFISLILKSKVASVSAVMLFLFCSLSVNMLLIALFHLNLPYLPYSEMAVHGGPLQLLTFSIWTFSDPISGIFAPQHDYLFGFPITLIILSILYKGFLDNRQSAHQGTSHLSAQQFAFAGMLAGLLPLTHPFSLVFVFIFALIVFAYSMLKKDRLRSFTNSWLPFGILAIALGVPQILFIKSGKFGGSFSGFVFNVPVWFFQGISVLGSLLMHVEFWFEVMGPILVLGLLGLYLFRKRLLLFAPAFAALVLMNVIRLSPSFGDSNKLTLYFLLFMAISATALLMEMWKRGGIVLRILAVMLFVCVVFGGIAGELLTFVNGPYPIASTVEVQASGWIRNNTPQHSMFVSSCYNTEFSMVSSLGARSTVMEFENYINLVGISNYNVADVNGDVSSFLSEPGCTLAERYNISYVVLENLSTMPQDWCEPVNYGAFASDRNFTQIASFGNGRARDGILIYRTAC
jgi:hypothetical protein